MTKKIKLYSLNNKEYPDIEIEVKVIENTSEKIKTMVDNKPFPAIKKATVQARKAKTGEVIDTRPRVEVNGKIYTFSETKRTITPQEEENGAVIVVNPDGEEYVIASKQKFNAKYQKTKDGYIAIDGVKHFIRSNDNYSIQTSWGEEQIVLKDSYFCVQDQNDIYGITNTAFDKTYTIDMEEIKQTASTMKKIKADREAGMIL